ncbi:MAG: hypothetical protein BRD51_03235 [Bacteroidetes bacterium SW_11_64_17]|nr:MAG: hypothetical protein BRD51_03235 [Bacteroidetes bacterium SW_11_64_17]
MHGLWTDLGEPEAHPSNMQHAAGPADAVHNVYNLLWAQTVMSPELYARWMQMGTFSLVTRPHGIDNQR